MPLWLKMIVTATTITVMTIAATQAYFQYFAKTTLKISTTTSLYETGLLDEIKKAFEAKYPLTLQFISVGTGIAIQHAKNGDVDLVLVHSPTLEKNFLEEGYGVCRKIIAYNFFAIVGPQDDPAEIRGLNVTAALQRIVDYGRRQTSKVWVSRGDNSGTHSKEKGLWESAGYNYTILSAESWYANVGSGMGQTLFVANEFSAYTLSDIGTYLKYVKEGRISLDLLITQEREVLNVYSAIAVNQTQHSDVNFNGAITFIKFLISDEGQQLIENYGKEDYGQSLFYGAVKSLKQGTPPQIVQWIQDYAFFNGSECPQEFWDEHPELYD